MNMKRTKIQELAEHYDTHDTSDQMEGGRVVSPTTDAMVVVSLRLPKHTMDEVRAIASARSVRPTKLIREWIEEHLAGTREPQGVVTVEDLIGFVRRHAVSQPPDG